MTLGYCLNVHPGETVEEVCAAFEGPVRRVVELAGPVGVGIYLANEAAEAIIRDERTFVRHAEAIAASGATIFSANAFPFGGFHGEVVKRRVYRPTWEEPARRDYTLLVARVLARLLPEGGRASISTAPVSFRAFGKVDFPAAGRAFAEVARELDRIAQETGRELAVAIEPEPLCVLERAGELVEFLERHVFPRSEVARKRIGACLDACHHAVVFEEIEDALEIYRRTGVRVVKAQLSSALTVAGSHLERLREFAEPRYLHQTFWRGGFAEDIEEALSRARGADEVRSHFHVPLAWPGSGALGTTRHLLERALPAIARATSDLEVETYTWSVLPEATRRAFSSDVASMVAAELAWVRAALPGGSVHSGPRSW